MCDWEGYISRGFDANLVEYIKETVDKAEISEVKPIDIEYKTGVPKEDAIEFLTLLASEEDVIEIKQRLRCPYCDELIRDTTSENGHHCIATNDTVDIEELETEEYFELNVDPSESIRWAVVIHGMNTRGDWQEDLVWKLSHIKKYSIPVYIYKYGIVRIGVTLKPLQNRKVKKLAKQLKVISRRADPANSGMKPHVIAHSFGSWLIAQTLLKNPDIRIGRLILLGSIVKPDFPWDDLINRGQVESVLNHTAGKDFPVKICQLFIPNSGPGGKVGFLAEKVINIQSPEFGHSGYFKNNRVWEFLAQDGIWSRFLQRPTSNLPDSFSDKFSCSDWKPFWVVFRVLVRYLMLLSLTGIVVFICYAFYTGLVTFL